MRFLDFFAGIGGFRLGMEAAGHECVGWVESDPRCDRCKAFTKHVPSEKRNVTICTVCRKEKKQHARDSYEAIHNTEGEWTAYDITTVSDEEWRKFRGTVDVICGGFPCQAFSMAGKRRGFQDTRGTLFFEIARAAEQIKPQLLFLENVKGLLSHNKGETFAVILSTLDELGYDAEWSCCNSKNFGVAHNRERVFIIARLRGTGGREVFPIRSDIEEATGEHQDLFSENKVYGVETAFGGSNGSPVFQKYMRCLDGQPSKGVLIKEATKKGYDIAYPGDSINYAVAGSKTRRGRVGKGVANTLDTNCQQGVLTDDYIIRQLTPRECWRLQTFPDWAFEKAAKVNSDGQLYKQAGNSVTVNVIKAIAKRL